MKLATNAFGERIEAGANAPRKAICPHCKGIVFLRARRYGKLPEDVTYFWRHENHSNTNCPEHSWHKTFS